MHDDPEHRRRAEAALDLTVEVERSPDGELRGADLGQIYARRYPELRVETPLEELLDSFAPDLTIVGRAGADLVWGLVSRVLVEDFDLDEARRVDEHRNGTQPIQASAGPLIASFENYRVLGDVRVSLDSLTVLVGRNGAGKSTLLDALLRSSLLTTRKPAAVFRDRQSYDRVVRRDQPEPMRLGLRIEDQAGFTFDAARARQGDPAFQWFMGDHGQNVSPSLLLTPLRAAFGGARLLKLDPRQLARPAYSPSLSPFLREDGFFLPAVMAVLQAEDPERLQRIATSASDILETTIKIRAPRAEVEVREPSATRTMIGNRLEVAFGTTGWTPADQLSEGTLLVLGLLTVLTRPAPPRLLLLDDVDRGLHPDAQRRLVQQLQGLAGPELRIVTSTHSPYVLDPLTPDAVRVVASGSGGAATVTPLSEHPYAARFGQAASAGELWQLVGDRWPSEP